jgi:hypothetical protein
MEAETMLVVIVQVVFFKEAAHVKMKYTNPSLKIILPIRERPVERQRSLYPVRHSTMKSTHIA